MKRINLGWIEWASFEKYNCQKRFDLIDEAEVTS